MGSKWTREARFVCTCAVSALRKVPWGQTMGWVRETRGLSLSKLSWFSLIFHFSRFHACLGIMPVFSGHSFPFWQTRRSERRQKHHGHSQFSGWISTQDNCFFVVRCPKLSAESFHFNVNRLLLLFFSRQYFFSLEKVVREIGKERRDTISDESAMLSSRSPGRLPICVRVGDFAILRKS